MPPDFNTLADSFALFILDRANMWRPTDKDAKFDPSKRSKPEEETPPPPDGEDGEGVEATGWAPDLDPFRFFLLVFGYEAMRTLGAFPSSPLHF